MRKYGALALLSTGLAFGQAYQVQEHLDEVHTVRCRVQVPKGFLCAILFTVDPPLPNGIDVASVVPGDNHFAPPPAVIREVSVILEGTLYTATFDPPVKRDGKFSSLRTKGGIPLRIDGETLIVQWPDGSDGKAKIIHRQRIKRNRPQPA